MQEILNAIKDTPIPTILVVSGILFLLLSVADQLAGKISINPARQRVAAAIGGALIILGVGVHILSRAPTPQSEVTDKIENKSEKGSDATMQETTNHETQTTETQTGLSLRKLGYGTLEGRVTNEDGEAIGMVIHLYLDGEEKPGFERSKREMGGFFQFLKLQPGIYEIHVARGLGSNYRPQRIKNVKDQARCSYPSRHHAI